MANAEYVAIKRGAGQGFIFNHNMNCYLILPKHIHGLSRRVTLSTVVPRVVGDAEILNLNSNHDLSIGYVSPGLEDKCTYQWGKLSKDISKLLTNNRSAILTRVAASGVLERVSLEITKYDLDTIEAKITGSEEIYKGTSGGFLSIENTLIGMATEAIDNKRVKFIRIDEIKHELTRLIDASGTTRIPKLNRNTQGTKSCKSSIKIKSVICNKEASSSTKACSNLAHNNSTILPVLDDNLELIINLSSEKPSIVKRVDILGRRETKVSAPPKTVAIFVSTSKGGADRWRFFSSGDVSPLGILTLENGSAPYARKLKILIKSSWNNSKPVQIDCVSIN